MVTTWQEHTMQSFLDWNPHNPKHFVSGSKDQRILIYDIDQKTNRHFIQIQKHRNDERKGVLCIKYNPFDQKQLLSC